MNKVDTQTLLTQNAYAKHRGCSHAAVAKAIKAGRLARCLHRDDKGRVRIDAAVADKEWAANTNEMKRTNGSAKESESLVHTSVTTTESLPVGSHSPAPSAESRTAGDGRVTSAPPSLVELEGEPSLADSRAAKEYYYALLAQLDYEQKSGKLIDAEEARRLVFVASRKTRDMLLTIADRLAPVVAGLDDQFACHAAISEEVRRVCEELAANPLGGAKQ